MERGKQKIQEGLIRLHCLGWPELIVEGQETHDQLPAKAIALLVYLAHHPEPQPRPKLMNLLWSESPEKKAQSSLRTTLYTIAQQNEALLEVTRQTVQLTPGLSLWIDSLAFQEGLEGDWSDKEEALSLYQDDFLANFVVRDAPVFERWSQQQRSVLHVQMMEHLLEFLSHCNEHHDPQGSLRWAERCIHLEPWEERAYDAMMRAYARRGEWAQALHTYGRCEEALTQELGVEPSRPLQRTRRDILWARDQFRSHLPRLESNFWGREEEIQQLVTWLCSPQHALVVIQGMGGMGKSHLARQVIERLEPRFLHGTTWLSLADLRDSSRVPFAIAKTLGLQLQGSDDIQRQVEEALQSHEGVLVFDAAEELQSDPETLCWLGQLPQSAPPLKLLFTSRVALPLEKSQHLLLRGLPVVLHTSTGSPEQRGAVDLLVYAIRQLDPDYDPAPDQDLLQSLCEELDGYPLGLKLLAPYFAHNTARKRLETLRQDWSRLESAWLDTPEQQTGLALLFEDIFNNLTPVEQKAATAFSVFVNGATFASCSAILNHAEESLPGLVRTSLVYREDKRYRMHAIIRHSFSHRLQQNEEHANEVCERHAQHYLAPFAQENEDILAAQEDRVAFASQEHENLRAAWEWACEHQRWPWIQEALSGLYHYLETKCLFHEGYQWLEDTLSALERLPEEERDKKLQAQLVAYMASLLKNTGRVKEGHQRAREAVAMCEGQGWSDIAYFARNIQGVLEIYQGNFTAAQQTLRQILQDTRPLDKPDLLLRPLINLGSACLRDGKLDEATQVLQEAKELCEGNEWNHGLSHVLNNLGMVALLQNDDEQAQDYFTQCLEVSQALKYQHLVASSWENLSELALRRKEYEEALAFAENSRKRWTDLGDDNHHLRNNFVMILSHQNLGNQIQSIQLCLESLSLAEELENQTVLMGLFCTIAEVWAMQGRASLARDLAEFVLQQPATEQQFRDKLSKLLERIKDLPQEHPTEPTTSQEAPASPEEEGLAENTESSDTEEADSHEREVNKRTSLEWFQQARTELEDCLLPPEPASEEDEGDGEETSEEEIGTND